MISNISEKIGPARKPHRCEECGRTIAKGEVYLRQVNTDGSQIWTFKAHPDCTEMSNQFRRENKIWGDEWLPLHEYFDDERQVSAWRGLFPHAACRIALTQNLNPEIAPEADMTTIQQQLRREIPLRDAAFGITGYEPINPDGPLAADHIDALEAACKRVLPLIEAAGREEVTDTRDWDEAEAMIRAAIGQSS